MPLMKLFGRSKHGKPKLLGSRDFKILLRAIKAGDIPAAQKTKDYELVDFNGNVVDGDKLEADALALEKKLRDVVGFDNTHVHPPPVKGKKPPAYGPK